MKKNSKFGLPFAFLQLNSTEIFLNALTICSKTFFLTEHCPQYGRTDWFKAKFSSNVFSEKSVSVAKETATSHHL